MMKLAKCTRTIGLRCAAARRRAFGFDAAAAAPLAAA